MDKERLKKNTIDSFETPHEVPVTNRDDQNEDYIWP
jgi:hypothetical protein